MQGELQEFLPPEGLAVSKHHHQASLHRYRQSGRAEGRSPSASFTIPHEWGIKGVAIGMQDGLAKAD